MDADRNTPILGWQALNRASLARQMLLERTDKPIQEAVSHLVALQAQSHTTPSIGLWSRVHHASIETCDRLLIDKTLVRLPLMRGTLHLSTATDALSLVPLFDTLLARSLRNNFGRQLEGVNVAEVAKAARGMLERTPHTYAELGRSLACEWPDLDAAALAQVARHRLNLVQAPPLLWHSSERPKVTTLRCWLNREVCPPAPYDDLVKRYLAAFGPASIADIQKWFGLTGFKQVIEAMAGQLCLFRSVDGEELYDLPDAPRPDPTVAAPVRLLSGFDAVVLGYRDLSRFIAAEHEPKLSTRNGLFHPVFLVDGRIAGLWKMTQGKSRLAVDLEPFSKLAEDHQECLFDEAEALSGFTGHNTVDVSFNTV